MFYVIHALDKPGQAQIRLDNYADHKSYLSNANIKTLVSGPLLDDDDETKIGSFFLIEAERKKDVIEFNANDPFARIGLWQSVCIPAFNKRVDNRDDSGASS
ncbi:YciI family protein [Paraburkholderia strydomiana]|uniref:YciI family protein n=1 Tax=Paraburkholderia strydomiana TaxID=1245417 RepID=UPI0038BC9EDB